MYKLLQDNGFEPNYEKECWTILEGFTSITGEKVRSIKYTPDFPLLIRGTYFIVETKGRPNDSWALKLKLIKQYMVNDERLREAKYIMPRNQQHCREVVEILKHYRETGEYIPWEPDISRRKLKDAKDARAKTIQ